MHELNTSLMCHLLTVMNVSSESFSNSCFFYSKTQSFCSLRRLSFHCLASAILTLISLLIVVENCSADFCFKRFTLSSHLCCVSLVFISISACVLSSVISCEWFWVCIIFQIITLLKVELLELWGYNALWLEHYNRVCDSVR